MIASVALGADPKNAKSSQCMLIDVELRFKHGIRRLNALLDTGAQGNFLSQRIVAEEGLKADPMTVGAIAADGHAITVYGRHDVDTVATDSNGVSRSSTIPFIATDIRRYDAILGFPWIYKTDPDCRFSLREWYHRGDIEVLEMSLADMLEDEAEAPVYAVYLYPANDLLDACVELNSTDVVSPELPKEYEDYADVFSEEGASMLPDFTRVRHAIPIVEGGDVPYGPIYPLSANELSVLRDYIETNLNRGWIRQSESPAGAPILFTSKKDGGLRLCVDYRGLNRVTVKNRHPLPLISEILDRLSGAAIYTSLDLRDAYHRIRVKEGDEWKTAFRTRYGHFEYLVMPFGLTNAPATFQAYINQALTGLLDVCCIAYLDDIVIYSTIVEEHANDVRKVLDRLRRFSLYVKLSKCFFSTQEIPLLGFIVSVKGVSMDMRRVKTITEWPPPDSYLEIQVFVGFANFYRRFIFRFSVVIAPMTDLLKGMVKGKKTGPFKLTPDAEHAFRMLQECFTKAPLLRHFDPGRMSQVETDASGNGLSGILSQPGDETDTLRISWHPVAFYSRKLIPAERNYMTGDSEMLAIVASFEEWRHYLESPAFTVRVLCDHQNLQSFMTTKKLNRRQARWAEFLAAFDFEIIHRKGKDNPADAPSRRPDYALDTGEEDENPLRDLILRRTEGTGKEHADHMRNEGALMLGALTRSKTNKSTGQQESQWSTLSGLTAEDTREAAQTPANRMGRISQLPGSEGEDVPSTLPNDLLPEAQISHLLALQSRDAWLLKGDWQRAVEGQVTSSPYTGKWQRDRWGLIRRNGMVYIPDDSATRMQILRANHDDPWQGGHFGRTRTTEVIQRSYWWPNITKDIRHYVKTCDVCQRMKTPRHKPYGRLLPLPQPERPWSDIAMDFITGLPPAVRRGKAYDAILVVVDRYSKMARYIACTTEIDASEMGNRLIEDVFSKLGFPRSIVSDRGTTFTSKYWATFCYYMAVKRCLSTAYHPQTDGQTERMNQTLECYLRCYTNYQQNNWIDLLPSAEYAHSDTKHSVTGKTPFEMVLTYAPEFHMRLACDKPAPDGENQSARESAERSTEAVRKGRELWLKSQEAMTKYYNRKHKDKVYRVGDEVMLASKNIRMRKPSKKLADKFLGPFRVEATVGRNAYRLTLPKMYGRIHPTFPVALLEPYQRREGVVLPDPVEIDGEDEWEVEDVLDARETPAGHKQFLVRWQGFTRESDSWEPEENLNNATDKIKDFTERRQRL